MSSLDIPIGGASLVPTVQENFSFLSVHMVAVIGSHVVMYLYCDAGNGHFAHVHVVHAWGIHSCRQQDFSDSMSPK